MTVINIPMSPKNFRVSPESTASLAYVEIIANGNSDRNVINMYKFKG